MTTDKTYNGWTNYETWAAKLWIDNDEGSCLYWEIEAQNCLDNSIIVDLDSRRQEAASDLARQLKDEHEEAQPELQGMYADMLNAAMSEIDWYEIAESLLAELTPSDSDED